MLSYFIAISTFVTIYAILALALNLMWGMTGMVNLGILGYYAIGGYVSAVLTARYGFPVCVGVAAGTIGAAGFGAASCIGLVKLRDDYLAIVTLGFAEMMRVVAENEISLTNGVDGIGRIPPPAAFGVGMEFGLKYLGLCLLAVAAVFWITESIRKAPLGRALRAIREDSMVAAAAGKNVVRFQALALTLGSGLTGFAGALYVHYVSYISPEIFQPQLLIYVFFALILGGRGNNWGALLGSILVMCLVEGTRFVAGVIPGLTTVQIGAARAMIIGVGFVLVLQWRPQGILPEPKRTYNRSPTVPHVSAIRTAAGRLDGDCC